MELSVVVCTRNRASYLPQMLEALTQLQAPAGPWELVFVDNGSSDDTFAALTRFCAHTTLPARLVSEPNKGLSNARNAGWRSAQGAIVSFTDDDCYPRADWLVAVQAAFAVPEVGYVGGRVLLFDPEDAPITIQPSEQPLVFHRRSHVESGDIIGANLSCRRSVLQAVEGFDPLLGAGTRLQSGEDTDLLIRASAAGFEGRYEPALVVYHHHRRRWGEEVTRLYAGYALGRGAVSMKAVLQPALRGLYVKNWYWRLRSLAQRRKFIDCWTEMRGAVHYLLRTRPPRTAPETPHRTPLIP